MSAPAWTNPATDSSDRVRWEGSWLVLTHLAAPLVDAPESDFGTPGLWRTLPGAESANARVFEIPPALRADDEPVSQEADPVAMSRGQDVAPVPGARPHHLGLLLWAFATENGAVQSDGPPLAPEDITAWAPPAARRVSAGAHVSQVEIIAKPERLALVVPALVRIPAELPLGRLLWLNELCRDAMRQWRLVRFGIDPARQSVRAEVDLTGAPPAYTRALFGLALAALTSSSAWALPGLALAANPSVESRLLDRMPRRRHPIPSAYNDL